MSTTNLVCRSIAFASDTERSWLSWVTDDGKHFTLNLGTAQIALLNRHFAAHVSDQYSLLAKPVE